MLRLEFIGFAGGDATIKELENNKSVINFSVAVDESYKDKNGNKVEKTKWIDCEVWNQAKLQPLVKKGSHVFVYGNVEAKAYLSKNETEPKASLVCSAERVILLDRKED